MVAENINEEFYQLLIKGASAGLWDWHDVSKPTVNYAPLFYTILGYEENELPPQYDFFVSLVHPEEQISFKKEINEHLINKIPFKYVHRLKMQGGTYRWFQFLGQASWNECNKPKRMAGCIIDITDQYIIYNDNKNKLQEAQDYKTVILESALNGILIINKNNIIQSTSPRAAQTFGYGVSQIIGKNIHTLIPAFNTELLTHPSQPQENIGINSDNHTFPVELFVSRYLSGAEYRYVIAIRDMTERKKIEQLKNEFISTVSHELRTPLTAIRGAIGLIRTGVGGPFSSKAASLLEIAHKNSERLILIINDILDIEKIESGQMRFQITWYNIKDIISQAVELNYTYGEKFGVNLVVKEPIIDCQVRVDSNRLMQVMTNLISNAVKYSPSRSTVEIATIDMIDFVKVTITDHGEGIPVGFRSRIFGKFAQADSSNTKQKSGTGLGLSISRAIIGQFGGKINFSTEEGKGTTFFFELPKAPLPIISDTKNTSSSSRILVCEDDEDIATFLKMTLEKRGYNVDIAFCGKQAKDLLKSYSYFVMTVDLTLPDMNGIVLIQNVRKNIKTKNLPIIVVSAKAEEGKKVLNGNAVNIIDWLTKPIDTERLMTAINKISGLKTKPTILYVEDDKDIVKILELGLTDTAKILHASTLFQANNLLRNENIDLILLDLSLPDGSGLKLLEKLDPQHPKPVIIFSASEVTPEINEKVSAALIKSKTSESTLIATITSLISKNIH